ncbi:MAG: DnaA N-terminal domain-containing protein, partial [Planctomycetota bacterium]|nr:DnaA N-terminal domain-containing protein [Planctomycetota bacterium]
MQPERAVTDETPMASISATPSAELSTAAESAPGAVLSGADATGDDADQAVELEQVWAALREALARRMQPEQYDTWFRRSALASVDDTTVRVAVQNTFARDWIKNYYTRAIDEAARELWSDGNPPRAIEIVVDPEAVARAAAAAPPEPEARAADTPAAPQPAET